MGPLRRAVRDGHSYATTHGGRTGNATRGGLTSRLPRSVVLRAMPREVGLHAPRGHAKWAYTLRVYLNYDPRSSRVAPGYYPPSRVQDR